MLACTLGGIGTGNIEIGVDGQFINWQLFNTLRDGYVPLMFAVKVGNVARLLQTAGGPNLPRVKQIEMTGEYPHRHAALSRSRTARETVDFRPSRRLRRWMSDFHRSRWPHWCSRSRIPPARIRPSRWRADAEPDRLRRSGAGRRSQHAKFGGNVNEPFRVPGAAGVLMRAEPGRETTIDRPVDIYVNDPLGTFVWNNTLFSEIPQTVHITGFANSAVDSVQIANPGRSVIWLRRRTGNGLGGRVAGDSRSR